MIHDTHALPSLCSSRALALAGCGSVSTPPAPLHRPPDARRPQRARPPGRRRRSPSSPAAEHPTATQFPPANGHTLQQLAATVGFERPARRGHRNVHARAPAVRVRAQRQHGRVHLRADGAVHRPHAEEPAQGPFLAPADPMTVAPQYRSKQNTGPGGIQAIYAAQLPLPHKGTYTMLALTRTQKGLIGAPAKSQSPPPRRSRTSASGRPAIATDTPASVARQHGAADDARAAGEHARGVVQGRARQAARRAPVLDAAAMHLAGLRAGNRHRRPARARSSASGSTSSTKRST